jgi:hypothetical protein
MVKAERGSDACFRALSIPDSRLLVTKALIEGLGKGKADLLRNGTITVSELDAFIAERVKTLTDGRQHPVMSRPNTIPDFAFAVVK